MSYSKSLRWSLIAVRARCVKMLGYLSRKPATLLTSLANEYLRLAHLSDETGVVCCVAPAAWSKMSKWCARTFCRKSSRYTASRIIGITSPVEPCAIPRMASARVFRGKGTWIIIHAASLHQHTMRSLLSNTSCH